MPRTTPGRVVVVGAGVVGASCAYELARRGWSVELLDRGTVGGACSHANCGYVCPSHVFPLAKPGAIAATLPLVLRPNSPFMVRPRPDLALLAWFARFARCCDVGVMMETSVALHALLVAAKRRYEEVIRDEAIACDYTAKGCLFVYQSEHHMDAFEPVNRSIQDRYGYSARRVDGAELTRTEPTLRDNLAGAWVFDCDAHLRPDRYMRGLHAALLRRGVAVRERCEVTGLAREGGRARRLATTQGEIAADAFVFAAGAWTPLLSDALAVRLPIVPGKGYSVTARRPAHCPAFPIVFEEHRVAITPFSDGYRIGSTMEFAGYDDSIRPERIALLRDSAALYLRHPAPLEDEQPWYGWRPMTPDGKPFIDFAPGAPNVLIAAGHNMIGMSTGPGTGVLAAELLTGETPHIDPRPFRIARE